MAIKIGHASIDENGKISGGKIGDQTGKEICIRNWYSKPWNVYIECTDTKIADKAATYMEQICADDNYGYDQGERLTGYNAIVKNNGKVKGAKGEFDCSSLVSSCYKFVGVNVSPSNTTRSIKNAFLATGKFKVYTDFKYLTNDEYAKRGGLYLKEGSHVVMALEDGIMNKTKKPTLNKPTKDWVKKLQTELNNMGYKDNNGNKLAVDGSAGVLTKSACPSLKKGTKNKLVGLVQERFYELGFDPNGIDNLFGGGMEKAVIEMKKKVMGAKNPTGILGTKSWDVILGLYKI